MHLSVAKVQRGWNEHPGGVLTRAGGRPLITVSCFTAWLNVPVVQMASLYSSSFSLSYPSFGTSLAVMAGSSFLGWLGAWMAVGRHLRELES